MKRSFVVLALATASLLAVMPAFGQKPKSQKEVDGLTAIQNATDADARLKAIDSFLTDFADTEFKVPVLEMAVQTAKQKGDYTVMTIWAGRALEANPKDYIAMLALSEGIASHTREFDLDKDEKLAKAEKYAHGAIDALKDAPKLRPQLTDEQWAEAKRDLAAEANMTLGMVAMGRKDYPAAVTDFKASIDTAAHPDPAVDVRLGEAYLQSKNYDAAIAEFDKAAAAPDAVPQVKQIAAQRKAQAEKMKAAPAATPKP